MYTTFGQITEATQCQCQSKHICDYCCIVHNSPEMNQPSVPSPDEKTKKMLHRYKIYSYPIRKKIKVVEKGCSWELS